MRALSGVIEVYVGAAPCEGGSSRLKRAAE